MCEKGVGKMKQAVGWHALIPGPITRPEEALAFINECGFCTWGPVPRLSFPNLAEAMGETATSVLDRTWSWKDDLHFDQQLYYGKIIAGQPSFLTRDYLPDFIAALAARGTNSYVWDLAERFWPQAFVDARHTAPLAARSKIRSQLCEFGLVSSPQLDQHLFLWT
jgi:hypothetical protein